ncbi:unnamed protein product [Vitrella brassicaformis CCMP3155]|uniref:RING-type domain-containing protein n=2 Tax=Vitrella brassicaformis TaxID=1169539 RepID=A0A0G4EVF5_VITBC|nr:unnamed protein product [Vitrella brassicaformis CCMP3155]|mmetsp:Transcript_35176/g.87352  ORF Transcript_35176/g.87352 Transcript_35176/m.87352 type:complete len:459 (+) Transcript_35176:366-1742(+)|eukprot:CEM02386.1 unnamed protein product [Vitrella brassicaformis CCMP3155]
MGGCFGSQVEKDTVQQLWQDRAIRWDQPRTVMALRPAEVTLQAFDDVEDTKGDNGLGRVQITNLRILWTSNTNPKLNISIGMGTIAYLHFNMVNSRQFQRVRAPNIMTQYNNTRFEFTFAIDSDKAMQLFHQLETTVRRYRATRTYRDLILRDEALLSDGELTILPNEEVKKKVENCDNLTTDESFPGTLFVTNLRVVWSAAATPNINVSVPFIQTRGVGTRASRFGQALVIETSQLSGGYILGFKFREGGEIERMLELINKLFGEAKKNPYFGPHDASVQVVDDRLVIVPPSSVQNVEEETTTAPQQPQQPQTATDSTSGPTAVVNVNNSNTLMLPEGAVQVRRSDAAQGAGEGGRSPSSRRARASVRVREPVTLDLTKRHDKEHVTRQESEVGQGVSPSSRKYMAPKCVICMAKPDECAFDPCGHVCACMDCAVKLDDCPICRTKIMKVLRVFLTT